MSGSEEVNLNIMKNDVVLHLFVDAADQDYALARFAYHKGIYNAFFWGAGQAIEKYLKSSLLLNGGSSISYGHDLEKLYCDVVVFADELLPNKLTQPAQFPDIEWEEETPTEFLERIKKYTSPDSRYNIFGHTSRYEDLCHLDQFVFALRRIAVNLDDRPFIGGIVDSSTAPKTYRDALKRFPNLQSLSPGSRLSNIIREGADSELREATLKLNFPFASDNYDHGRGGISLGFSMGLSVLTTRVFSYLGRPASEIDLDVANLADWIRDNIKLPRDIKDGLEQAAAELRDRNQNSDNSQ